jgi:hypothetical protein
VLPSGMQVPSQMTEVELTCESHGFVSDQLLEQHAAGTIEDSRVPEFTFESIFLSRPI